MKTNAFWKKVVVTCEGGASCFAVETIVHYVGSVSGLVPGRYSVGSGRCWSRPVSGVEALGCVGGCRVCGSVSYYGLPEGLSPKLEKTFFKQEDTCTRSRERNTRLALGLGLAEVAGDWHESAEFQIAYSFLSSAPGASVSVDGRFFCLSRLRMGPQV